MTAAVIYGYRMRSDRGKSTSMCGLTATSLTLVV